MDQAETALGAEMRIAASKGKGKVKGGEDKAKDKIVRRFVYVMLRSFSRSQPPYSLGNSIKSTQTEPL